MLIAGVAEVLLRAEVVAQQPRRHPGRTRDVADRGLLEAVLGEMLQCRVADAGPSGQVVHATSYTHV
jgi:hypothetical protein